MLSFSDQELDRITAAAALLPVHQRDRFLRSVGNMLGGLHHDPTSDDLEGAITTTLNAYGVALGSPPARTPTCKQKGYSNEPI